MADIQAALPASFMQVANTQKIGAKEHAAAGLQLASFLGVLKSQIIHQDAALEPPVKADAAAALGGEASDAAVPLSPELMAAQEVAASSADAAAQTAIIAAAFGFNLVAEKQPQTVVAEDEGVTVEADALEPGTTDASHAKPVVQAKPEALLKPNGAAIAAAQGQALPQAEADAVAQGGVVTPVDAKLESLASAAPATSTLVRGETVTGSAVPISVTHTFDQALRQAESKIHAAIETPVRSPAFAAELGDKVVWLATRQGQFAELSLNPPQMGSLEVRLKLSAGEASAQFFSPNPVVREMLDAALPRLRELMAQAGINLGEAEVREQAFGHREQPETRQQSVVNEVESLMLPAAMAGNGGRRSSGSGLVDLYI